MKRQHLTKKASREEYDRLYRDMQPGLNVYWNGFGDPPSQKRISVACRKDIWAER